MSVVSDAVNYVINNSDRFWQALGVHAYLAVASLAIGTLLCVPLGIWAARSRIVSGLSLNAVGILRVVPSLAVLVLVFPYLGLGTRTALVALTILAGPPILINTYVAYRDVDAAVVEAAVGMGMTRSQILRWIETPLALPVVLTGIRTAAGEVVASATLAAFIGGGGMGEFIVNGLAVNNIGLLLVGAVPVAVLALFFEGMLAIPEHFARRRT